MFQFLLDLPQLLYVRISLQLASKVVQISSNKEQVCIEYAIPLESIGSMYSNIFSNLEYKISIFQI